MATQTTNLTAFLPLVQPHTPGAALPTITQALRKSAIEFCEKTRCWRTQITANLSRQAYPIVAPAYAAIHEIERAEFDGTRLTPVEYDQIGLAEFDGSGQPSVITQAGPNEVSIVPFSEGKLTCSLFLKPKHDFLFATDQEDRPENYYDTVPDFLLSRYGETIAAGAIARVLVIPQQPFTNFDLAAVHAAQFQDGLDRFNAANVRGQHRARPRVNAHWF